MPPCRKWTARVQFLPILPSHDISGWVKAHATQAPSDVPGGEPASRLFLNDPSGHPTCVRGDVKRRRQDFPVVRTGRNQLSHADLDRASQRSWWLTYMPAPVGDRVMPCWKRGHDFTGSGLDQKVAFCLSLKINCWRCLHCSSRAVASR